MYNIWLYFEVWCSLKSFSWKVEVKPSKTKKPARSAKPYILSSRSARGAEIEPVMRNSVTPPVTAAATIQSMSVYCFWEIRIPQTI